MQAKKLRQIPPQKKKKNKQISVTRSYKTNVAVKTITGDKVRNIIIPVLPENHRKPLQ